ncbi:Uncharacterized domain UPF0547 [Trinorchestia longiramus]|nr:Uncharacterized domain UPF0547 [Trinorchestia longiramus]
MPPKGVGKAVSKRCPQCKKQIPVATRLCACGHQFFEERRRSSTALTPPQDSGGDIDDASAAGSVSSDAAGLKCKLHGCKLTASQTSLVNNYFVKFTRT